MLCKLEISSLLMGEKELKNIRKKIFISRKIKKHRCKIILISSLMNILIMNLYLKMLYRKIKEFKNKNRSRSRSKDRNRNKNRKKSLHQIK